MFVSIFSIGLTSPIARAVTIGLIDYGINIDGVSSFPTLGDHVPIEADIRGLDTFTGLGEIVITIDTPGDHLVGLFVDSEIDEIINTFFNETGDTSGMTAVGQTWEIDEPGFLFGDIFDNFANSNTVVGSQLDNSIFDGLGGGFPDDVSIAIIWEFALGANETSTTNFFVSDTGISSGLTLLQIDPDSDETILFSSSLNILADSVDQPVPEPSTVILLGIGMAGLGFIGWKKKRTRKRNTNI